MTRVRLIEDVDPFIENLIHRAATLLGFGLSEVEVRDIMVDDTTMDEVQIYFAIKAAVILNRP